MNVFRQNALTTSHIVWLAGLWVASLIGAVTGTSLVNALIVSIVGSLPCAAFFLLRNRLFITVKRPGDSEAETLKRHDSENLLIVVWLLSSITLAGLLAPGQSASGLVVILSPMIALLIGRQALVRETAVFALLVSLTFLGLAVSGAALPGLSSVSTLEPPVTALIIGTTLLLILLMMQSAVKDGEAAERQLRAMQASAKSAQQHMLLPDAPWLLVQVAATGRIESVLGGDELWWPDLVVGRPIHTAFPDLYRALQSEELANTPLGDIVYVRKARLGDGSHSLLIASPGHMSSEPTIPDTTLGQDNWISGLGHDLKTPLNAVLGFSEIMMMEQFGPLPERYGKYPELIHKSGAQLQYLIDDIMDLSKAGADRYELDLEPVDLTEIAEDVCEQFEHLKDQAGVTLDVARGAQILAEADMRAVSRIWQNLVSNAIKYSHEGGTVTLAARREQGMAVIEVSDQGIGMSEEDMSRIAEPFSQGKNAKGKAGTGLGLAVVRTFAELHGGKMVIQSAPDAGTQISVYLPAINDLEKAAE